MMHWKKNGMKPPRRCSTLGGKLYAANRMINRDPVSLFNLDIPEQGENFGSWKWSDLADRAGQHRLQDLLSM